MAARLDSASEHLSRTTGLLTNSAAYTVMELVRQPTGTQTNCTFFMTGSHPTTPGPSAYERADYLFMTGGGVSFRSGTFHLGSGAETTSGDDLNENTWYWVIQRRTGATGVQFGYAPVGGSITWDTGSTQDVSARAAAVAELIGARDTGDATNFDVQHFKAWSTNLSDSELNTEILWGNPQRTSNIHTYTPFDSDLNSTTGTNWTATGTVGFVAGSGIATSGSGVTISCNLGVVNCVGLQATITGSVPTTISCALGVVSVVGKTATIYSGHMLTWDASDDPGVTGYFVVWDTVSRGSYDLYANNSGNLGAATDYTISGLLQGTTYYYRDVSYIVFGETDTYGETTEQTFVAGATVIDCNVGVVNVTGLVASIGGGVVISCNVGAVNVTGLPANISNGFIVSCAVGVVNVTGLVASIAGNLIIPCALGVVNVVGLVATITGAVSGSVWSPACVSNRRRK